MSSIDSFFSLLYGRVQERRKPYTAKIKRINSKGIATLDNGTQVEVSEDYKPGMTVVVMQTDMNPLVVRR